MYKRQVLCSAAVLGLGGCSNKVDAATTLPLVNESRPVVVESEEPTSSAEETTVVETVSGTIESAEEQPEQAEDSVCPVSYTHLDVYKRQVNGCDLRSCTTCQERISIPENTKLFRHGNTGCMGIFYGSYGQ